MELLDAILAFALTLAALATIVTIILETGHRALGMRRRNLAQILKLLYDELESGKLDMPPEARWTFIAKTLGNPAVSVPSIPSADEVARNGARPPPTVADRIFLAVAWLLHWIPGQSRAQQMIAARKAARRIDHPATEAEWKARVGELTTVNLKAGVYDRVSVEHVLRRLAETDGIRQQIEAARSDVEDEFNRIARKFEEFGSAVSADFKRRSQTYSVLIGILFALAANIDGVRIFESFRNNPAAAKSLIAQEEKIRETYDGAVARLDAATTLRQAAAEKRAELEAAPAAERPKLQQELDALDEQLAAAADPARLRETADRARRLLVDMTQLGVPMGSAYFPHCRSAYLNPEGCAGAEAGAAGVSWLKWLLSALLTGALIGLGAPFWFDVAKRLAEVRAMFGGKSSAEGRLSGNDANADPDKRRKIVAQVLADTVPENAPPAGGVG